MCTVAQAEQCPESSDRRVGAPVAICVQDGPAPRPSLPVLRSAGGELCVRQSMFSAHSCAHAVHCLSSSGYRDRAFAEVGWRRENWLREPSPKGSAACDFRHPRNAAVRVMNKGLPSTSFLPPHSPTLPLPTQLSSPPEPSIVTMVKKRPVSGLQCC